LKVLFVTLEQSARENLKVVLNNQFFTSNNNNCYTFGMSKEGLPFKDLTNIQIKSLMGFVDIIKNLPYLFNLRNYLNSVVKDNNFTHIFFIDSYDFSKFYINKFRNKAVKYCQLIGPSVFIWNENKAKFINKYFDHIFSIFEVEREFYDKEKYSYIGHPLLNNVTLNKRNRFPIKNIGIFLGSRYQEIIKNMPIITDLIVNLKKLDDFQRYIGRKVKIKSISILDDGKNVFTGSIEKISDNDIEINDSGKLYKINLKDIEKANLNI